MFEHSEIIDLWLTLYCFYQYLSIFHVMEYSIKRSKKTNKSVRNWLENGQLKGNMLLEIWVPFSNHDTQWIMVCPFTYIFETKIVNTPAIPTQCETPQMRLDNLLNKNVLLSEWIFFHTFVFNYILIEHTWSFSFMQEEILILWNWCADIAVTWKFDVINLCSSGIWKLSVPCVEMVQLKSTNRNSQWCFS